MNMRRAGRFFIALSLYFRRITPRSSHAPLLYVHIRRWRTAWRRAEDRSTNGTRIRYSTESSLDHKTQPITRRHVDRTASPTSSPYEPASRAWLPYESTHGTPSATRWT